MTITMATMLTTREAADVAGVEPGTIWVWVNRGWLSPVVRGARPHLYLRTDIEDCSDQRAANESRRHRLAQREAARRAADMLAERTTPV